MATSAVATLGVLLMVLALVGAWLFQGPGPAAHATDVVLPSGARTPEIAAALDRAGAISSSTVFLVAAQLTGAARHLPVNTHSIRTLRWPRSCA